MGIKIEFNPDLALRIKSEEEIKKREPEEFLPEPLEEGKVYNFLKSGQRCYWLHGELALLRTAGNQQLSRPLASIKIEEATHFLKEGKVYTKGKYKVIKVFNENDPKIEFEWMERVKDD
jgi:hypothetical protein